MLEISPGIMCSFTELNFSTYLLIRIAQIPPRPTNPDQNQIIDSHSIFR